MDLSDILILDLDPNSCPVDNCGQIAKLLPKLLPNSEVVIQTGTRVPSETKTTFLPDLILLKSCLTEKLHKAVRILKEEWRANSVLGIFCTNSDAPVDVCQAIADDMGLRKPWVEKGRPY